MTDKTTPEKIALVVLKDQIHNYQQFYAVQPTTGHVDEALVYQEYIRADLVPSCSADEPLAHGQWRWVRVKDGDAWEAAWVPDGQKIRVALTSVGLFTQQLAEIGPVIQPPPDQRS